jgi:tetratricopeptide (TPR) repeat protein
MRRLPLEIGISFALAIMTLAVFSWSCGNDFVNYDDGIYVTENPSVRAGLTAEGVGWAFTTFHAGNWHPLTWLSLQLDAQIYGIQPWGFHLTNVLLHTANTVLLFWALLALLRAGHQKRGRESFLPQSSEKPSTVVSGGKDSRPLFCCTVVAALFAVHPLHVESVAWVAERKDVLSSLFWMLALLSYGWYVSCPRWTRYLAVVASMALGLLAKPMLVTLPFVFLLLDYWPLGRYRRPWTEDTGERKRRTTSPAYHLSTPQQLLSRFGFLLAEKLPLFALSVGSSIVTWQAQYGPAIRSLGEYSLPVRLTNALVAYCAYIGQSLWPVHLGVHYPHPAGEINPSRQIRFPLWQPLAAFTFLSVVSVLAVSKRRSLPYLFVGWFWYLGTLVPVIGLVQLAGQARADRYMYIPSVGLLLAAVGSMAGLALRQRYQKPAAAIAGLSLLLLSLQSFVQVSYWRDSRTLWQHALDACGESTVAHTNLAWALYEKGYSAEAARHDSDAIRIDPDNITARAHLGVTLFQLGQKEAAFRQWDEALRLKPDWDAPRYNRALAFLEQGQKSEAIAEYELILRQIPDAPQAHYFLALLIADGERSKEAEAHFRQALEGARAKGQNELSKQIEQAFESYRSGKSFRISPKGNDQ